MEFGLSFLPDSAPSDKSPAAYFDDVLNLVSLADEMGLHSVKITEHYMHPYGGYCSSPIAFLTAAATRSRRIRLVTGCILAAFHHPIQIAADIAMLDAISKGRAEAGFARAYLPYEFAALGVPIDENRPRFTETVETVVRLWTEPKVTHQGTFYRFEDVTSLPRPTQKPCPPVWIAAVQTTESFQWAGEKGYRLMLTPMFADYGHLSENLAIYRAAYRRSGHVGEPVVTLTYPLYLASTKKIAERDGTLFLNRYLKVWIDAAQSWDGVSTSQYPNYTNMAAGLRQYPVDRLLRERRVLIGEPAAVQEWIAEISEQFGVHHMTFQVDFGSMPGTRSRRNLELLAAEVLAPITSVAASSSP